MRINSGVFGKAVLRAGLVLLCAGPLFADTIKLKDGSVIKGSVTGSDGQSLEVATQSGRLTIARDALDSVEKDKYSIRLRDGSVIRGEVRDIDEENMRISTAEGEIAVPRADVISVSTESAPAAQPAQSPQARAESAPAAAAQPRPERAAPAGRSRRRSFDIRVGYWRPALKIDLTEYNGGVGTSLGSSGVSVDLRYMWYLNSGLGLGLDAGMLTLMSHTHSYKSSIINTSGEIFLFQGIARASVARRGNTDWYAAGGAGLGITVVHCSTTYESGDPGKSGGLTGTQPVISAAFGFEKELKDLLWGMELRWLGMKQAASQLSDSGVHSIDLSLKLAWKFSV